MTRFGPAVPILRIFDEDMARDFYLRFLGFEVAFEHRFAPDMPLYLAVRQGDCELHLTEHFGDATPGSAVRLCVPDVAAYCKEINARGHKNARPGLQKQPWGTQEMSIADPFSNRLTFWTNTPDDKPA